MDVLLLQERILKTIELGESQFREFKSALQGEPGAKSPRPTSSVAKDIAEALVAFANADGGELLIGVEDDGTITGIPFDEDKIATLLKAPITGVFAETPLPTPIATKISISGKKLLYFAVDKSTRSIHQTSDGRCLQRRDLESVPVSASKLQFERQEQISREYDRQFIDGASVTDLDIDLVKAVSDETARMSPEKCLQYLGLGEYGIGVLRLRRAALLLFAKKVELWHPRCQVRILRIRGTELRTGREYNVTSDEPVVGNILQLLTTSWDQLRPHLVATKLTEGALFKEQIMYPEDACREALINAITHRDYSVEGKNIEIHIFDDRMEVRSPGALLSTITVDDLRRQQGAHESRNAHIARVLREIGYVREMGEGMRRIFRLMKDADLIPPEIKSAPGQFSVSLFHRSVFSIADQAWLAGYRPLKLSREEMLVAMLGKEGQLISPRQIYTLLNLHDWDIYRTVFEQLSWKGVLHNVLSEADKNKLRRRDRGVSNRDIARLQVRQPELLEKALGELFACLAKQPPTERINLPYCNTLRGTLPKNNPYNMPPIRLIQLFRTLDLIDDQNSPTRSLTELWKLPASDAARRPNEDVRPVNSAIPLKAPTDHQSREPETIHVGNMDYAATEDDLRAIFENFGKVKRIRVSHDYTTNRNRGFAFVTMQDRQAAADALEQAQGRVVMGRPIVLSWARFGKS
ncbi:ATP-binding protein [Bradyrhizobium oligotrophicum]|uniref:ATP-binding protein n=1 Tax=Bradyrhizobium oligotrophicum TaxID=44255 RepID=UPI003EBCB3EC